MTIDSLVPGVWGVTVDGVSSAGTRVASANVHVTVVEGQTASADVAVGLSAGKGNLDLSFAWPAGITASASLTPEGGAPFAIVTTKDVSPFAAAIAVPAGYYTLSRVFRDSAGRVWGGGADAIEIEAGSTTSFVLSVVSGVNVTITPDISKDIPIGFNGSMTNIQRGTGTDSSMTLVAKPEIPNQAKSVTYQWYLNGELLPTESSSVITINGRDHPVGGYRLDVVVAVEGKLGSANISFTIDN